jgi:hypothetical protein
MIGNYRAGQILFFRDIGALCLYTVVFGTGIQDADLQQRQHRDGNFGSGSLGRTWKEIEKHSRNCEKLDGLFLLYGSVR